MTQYIEFNDTEILNKIYLSKISPTSMTLLYKGELSRKRVNRLREALNNYEKNMFNTVGKNSYCRLLHYMLYNIGKYDYTYKTLKITKERIEAITSPDTKEVLLDILNRIEFTKEIEEYDKEIRNLRQNRENNGEKRAQKIDRKSNRVKDSIQRYNLAKKNLSREELQQLYCNIVSKITGKTCGFYKARELYTKKFGATHDKPWIAYPINTNGFERIEDYQPEGIADIRLLIKLTKTQDYLEFLHAVVHKTGSRFLGLNEEDMIINIGLGRDVVDILLYKMGITKEIQTKQFSKDTFKVLERIERLTHIQ